MHLYILRHGDAESSPSLNDSDRALSQRGKREVERVGLYLQQSKTQIDLIVSSPLLRAKETAATIQQMNQIENVTTSEFLVPESNIAQLLKELNELTAPAVLLIGHEPQMSALISVLISGSERAHIEMKKATLACLAVQKPVQEGMGLLRWLIPVANMDTRL